jgi:hypothetical protein
MEYNKSALEKERAEKNRPFEYEKSRGAVTFCIIAIIIILVEILTLILNKYGVI